MKGIPPHRTFHPELREENPHPKVRNTGLRAALIALRSIPALKIPA
jgi:hypothetical protein